MKKFMGQFVYDQSKTLFIGIERECFLTNTSGEIVPIAHKVLEHFVGASLSNDSWGYELSACQLESRCGPCSIDKVEFSLEAMEKQISAVEKELGFLRNHNEVASETMPLDVFPDPTGRYAEIVKKMPKEVLLAACRVIGTHVHVGMPNHEMALHVYNKVIKHTAELCKLGDKSSGKRLEIYKIVAPEPMPIRYESWQDFYDKASEKGFVSDPRKCWSLIRISKHGTIEFRMFGTTANIAEITKWAQTCHSLCQQAILEG